MAKIEPIEHWCADGCGEVIEDKGQVQRVRRWVLKVDDRPQGVGFASKQEAEQFAREHGIEIDGDHTSSTS